MIFRKSRQAIDNPVNGKSYHLVPLTDIEPTESQLDRVVSICNEPLVFDTLFSGIFPEGRYPLSWAEGWIQSGKRGWKEGSHFMFATLDESGLVVAACDIKSANMESAEIGYWASALHRGVMTNSLSAILQFASESGFREFFAEVLKDNLKSQGVLVRNSFSPCADTASKPHHMVFRRQRK